MQAEVKLWTVEDANALLPRLDRLVTELARAVKDADAAVAEARRIEGAEGPGVRVEGHPRHADLARLLGQSAEARARVEALLREFAELGVEVKDPAVGLVDFPTIRGHDVVYLCWRQGEPEVAHWHSLAGGFAARKPLDDLVRAAGR